jgi:hypothetical protein
MSGMWGNVLCATAIWVIMASAAYLEPAKRAAGEAWVVTSSDEMANRPMLVRAHVPVKVVAAAAARAE